MLNDTCETYFPIDKNYLLWVTHTCESGQVWYITSDILRTEYQLWKGKKKTLRKSNNPLDLYQYIK